MSNKNLEDKEKTLTYDDLVYKANKQVSEMFKEEIKKITNGYNRNKFWYINDYLKERSDNFATQLKIERDKTKKYKEKLREYVDLQDEVLQQEEAYCFI